MISKAKTKLIRSLEHRKARKEEGLFVAEGPKVVGDLMKVAVPEIIAATDGWLGQHGDTLIGEGTEVYTVTQEELQRLSFLQHPQQVLAVFRQDFSHDTRLPLHDIVQTALRHDRGDSLFIALDSVQDPGNLGTIIRVADWFGIEHVFCSEETADPWNPKVVQATMGSLARVNVTRCDLHALLDEIEAYNRSLPPDASPFPVYGTFLDGADITARQLERRGLLVMGNEGNGISPSIAARVNDKLLIPSFPEGRETADSLNVAIATAIACFAIRRG